MNQARALAVWVLASLAAASAATLGCGGDDETGVGGAAPAPTCAASVAFSGGFEGGVAWADIACGVPFGPEAGVEMVFLPGDATIAQFVVRVADVHGGETGTFDAGCGLILRDDRRWSTSTTDCSIAIDANVLEEHAGATDVYAVHGTGSCTAAAEAVTGTTGADVAVGPFEVQFPARWPAK